MRYLVGDGSRDLGRRPRLLFASKARALCERLLPRGGGIKRPLVPLGALRPVSSRPRARELTAR